MAVMLRNESDNELCNICGRISNENAGVWYPKNAARGGENNQHIRICFNCVTKMANVFFKHSESQTG
jgi:hypothetical protein